MERKNGLVKTAYMQGGPRRSGSVITLGTALYADGTMKSVHGCAGTVSTNFSAVIKDDSATRLRRSQLKPDLFTDATFPPGVFNERSV